MLRSFRHPVFTGICLCMLFACKFSEKGTSPSPGPVAGITDTVGKWLDWVGEFTSTTDSVKRSAYLVNLTSQLLAVRSDVPLTPEDSLNSPVKYFITKSLQDSIAGPFQLTRVRINFCNCPNPMLWNVVADLGIRTDTTGPSTPTSPKPGSGTNVTGGVLEELVKNESLNNPAAGEGFINSSAVVSYPAFRRRSAAVIAIIDTGIDTMLFDNAARDNLFWNGPSASYNLLPGYSADDYSDDHPLRHGTSVASIAMNAFSEQTNGLELPQLMVLKAADSLGRGTLFSYMCALAYAIENGATVINSSMGFYGEDNPLLNYFLRQARADSILIVAAAGNASGSHSDPLCRNGIDDANRLQAPGKLFFPAVQAQDQQRYTVISVTGESEPGQPCYFQNYSDQFVTLGVVNSVAENSCCAFRLPYISEERAIEGSSFAAPVVSGKLAYRLIQSGRRLNVRDHLSLLEVSSAPVRDWGAVTQSNQFISY